MIILLQDTLKLLPDYLTTTHSVLASENLFVLIQKLGIAILIGALIGLERERARSGDDKTFAGIRTYPLISMLGFSSALVGSITSMWIYAAIFTGYAALITASHVFSARMGRFGGTSEISTFLVFVLGSLVFWNYIILAAIIAVVITILLSLKIQLHTFAGKVSEEDLYATLKFAIITVIILPLLPDKTYGPFNVLNPRLIWYMVVLISGISFVGYIFINFFGKDRGIGITGLMGGMVSSTAVTFSLSRRSAENPQLSGSCATGIILASTVMNLRIFIVTVVLNSELIKGIWLPLLILTITGLIISYVFSKKFRKDKHEQINLRNPFELKSALLFGLLFGVIIFISKAAKVYFGTSGIYAASGLAGLTSVDAIVLSLAKLSTEALSHSVAIAAIIIAIISNTVVKGIIAVMLGSAVLKKYALYGLSIITVVASLYLGISLIY